MTIIQKRFIFFKTINSCNLRVRWEPDCVRDYEYPISYTMIDCLEDWCAFRRYNFISVDGDTRNMGDIIVGMFKYYGVPVGGVGYEIYTTFV